MFKTLRFLNRNFFSKKSTANRQKLFAGFDPNISINSDGCRPIFVTGTGRSGTHFFSELFGNSSEVMSLHLDDVATEVGDSYQLFSQWHGLLGDNSNFLNSRSFLIKRAEQLKKRYLESNPLLAFSLNDLRKRFACEFIIVVRNPIKVVESHLRKGWYKTFPRDVTSIMEYNYAYDRANHCFSRFMPKTEADYEQWKQMTQLGKIAWMYKSTYTQIFRQLKSEDRLDWKVVSIDNFDFSHYCDLARSLGITRLMTEGQFNKMRELPPGSGAKSQVSWDEKSRLEFNSEIAQCLDLFRCYVDVDRWLF